MAYAAVSDMVARFGTTEMVRLSTPDGADLAGVVADPIETALDDASATIDSYLRGRYPTPLDIAPPEIRRACTRLARYDLYTGEQKSPTEQVTRDRDATIAWLRDLATGKVKLDLAEVPSDPQGIALTTSPGDNSDAAFTRGGNAFDDAFGGSCYSPFWNGGGS